MNASARCLLSLLLLPAAFAAAHEGHDHPPGAVASPLPAAMLLPSIDGPKPWSDKPLLNDPDRFQIAIMTDRTGGHRPGVWMDAVRKLNLLRPEFVVSVGDLIEGYTEDRDQIEREWTEFLGFIDQMQMRFFFVAGNHDLTNNVMHGMWRERFGPEWYSFDYKGVHFLCLCSEDPTHQHISDEQIAFVKKDLAEHTDARWTLVFLHKPLWTYAERGIENDGVDPTNWKRVESLLVDRPHTIFSGHVHHYVQYQRNGHDYYSLATTGGGSRLRGDAYGEFDHVTWLTMEDDGPHVVNLRLDGILPPDVVTEESAGRFREFLERATVRVAPILLDDDNGFDEGDLQIQLINELGRRVDMTGRFEGLPLKGLTVAPEALRLSVGPTGTAEQAVRVRFGERLPFKSLRRATFVARLEAESLDGAAPITAEREIPVIIDRRYACPLATEPFAVDGRFEALAKTAYATPDQPLVVGASQEWQGPQDGSFSLTAEHDNDRVVFRIRATDERVVSSKDRITLVFDTRTADRRQDDPRLRRGTMVVSVGAPASDRAAAVDVTPGWRDWFVEGTTAAGRQTEGGYDLEIAIPSQRFSWAQRGEWKDFQMAAVMTDVDDPQREPAEIVWRGSADYRSTNAGFARFHRGE